MAETDKRRVLVVDDELELTKVISKVLTSSGFSASVASDGNTAIEKVRSESPEVVILDIHLPDIDGKDVLKKIRDIDVKIATIIITGNGRDQSAVDFMKAGAIDFISKPFEMEVLVRSVKNALALRDAQIDDKAGEGLSSLERFFPFLAHEVRNPLHAIAGALNIIQKRSDAKDQLLAQSIRIIQEEVKHLNEFVQECLHFVRPPAKSRYVEIDLDELVSVIINTMSHMFPKRFTQVEIEKKMASQLPKIQGNYEEIKQAFFNIMKNSFEAMQNGGRLSIRASVKPGPGPGRVEIEVVDNGSGIKKEDMKNIFAPFFTTKMKGTGLGLAISRRTIVERHHGKMNVMSDEGQGTTVTIQLPISQEIDTP